MRTLGLLVLGSGMLASSLLASPQYCAPGAGIWNEGDGGQGDAGKMPGNANITTGLGAIDEICGALSNSTSGGDMYEIEITGTTFSAETSPGATNGLNDPALYLFDSSGDGLDANNDVSPSSTQAGFSLAGLTPGLYYLEIVPNNQEPENHNGKLIFGDITGTNTSVFTPVVGNTKLDSWTDAGTGVTGADYVITLTDASFADQTPEPATFGLIGLGLGVLAFARRRT
jgi:PEP-CTERM motif